MISIEASIVWTRSPEEVFVDRRYSRAHRWRFDGGVEVPASSSPHIVREPFSKPENVDPEEAFIAAISSCHLLVFLDIAARGGFVVDAYDDAPVGVMEKNAAGTLYVSRVTLRPMVRYVGHAPASDVEDRMHHEAHEGCFIAQSVRTEITVERR